MQTLHWNPTYGDKMTINTASVQAKPVISTASAPLKQPLLTASYIHACKTSRTISLLHEEENYQIFHLQSTHGFSVRVCHNVIPWLRCSVITDQGCPVDWMGWMHNFYTVKYTLGILRLYTYSLSLCYLY